MFHPKGPTLWELARQALSSTERGYELLAPKFDYTPFRTPDCILEAALPFVGREVKTALDVCCGTGAGMQMLHRVSLELVVGIDTCQAMLDVACQNLQSLSAPPELEFVRGDAMNMPFEEEFDAAVCFGALGHLLPKDQPRFVEQVAKALRPGGRFVIATGYPPPIWSARYLLSRGFNAAMRVRNLLIRPPFIMYYLTFLAPEAIRMFESAGLKVEVHEGVFDPPYHHGCLVVGTKEAARISS